MNREYISSITLDGHGFVIYNKHLAKLFGPIAAIFLGEVISEYKYWKGKNQLTEDGFFYSSKENILNETSLSFYAQQQAIDIYNKYSILDIKSKGMPKKRYFRINFDKLDSCLMETQTLEQLIRPDWEEKKRTPEKLKEHTVGFDEINQVGFDTNNLSDSTQISGRIRPEYSGRIRDINNNIINNNNLNKNKKINTNFAKAKFIYSSLDKEDPLSKFEYQVPNECLEKPTKKNKRGAGSSNIDSSLKNVNNILGEKLNALDNKAAAEKRLANQQKLKKQQALGLSSDQIGWVNKLSKLASEKLNNKEVSDMFRRYLIAFHQSHEFKMNMEALNQKVDFLNIYFKDDNKAKLDYIQKAFAGSPWRVFKAEYLNQPTTNGLVLNNGSQNIEEALHGREVELAKDENGNILEF